MRRVTVVTEVNGKEAIYVNGKLVFRDDTVYACEICRFSGNNPVLLKHEECEFDGYEWDWPEKLENVPLLPDEEPTAKKWKPRK